MLAKRRSGFWPIYSLLSEEEGSIMKSTFKIAPIFLFVSRSVRRSLGVGLLQLFFSFSLVYAQDMKEDLNKRVEGLETSLAFIKSIIEKDFYDYFKTEIEAIKGQINFIPDINNYNYQNDIGGYVAKYNKILKRCNVDAIKKGVSQLEKEMSSWKNYDYVGMLKCSFL